MFITGKMAVAALSGFVLMTGLGQARAADTDSEHLFGFTEGSDIGEKGEKEAEFGVFGRLSKRAGSYAAFSQSAELKMTLTDNFRVAPGVFFTQHSINNVTGIRNYSGAGVEGFSFEMKYRLLDRQKAPFGLTLALIPSWSRIDDATGTRANSFGTGFLVSADRELIENKLYGALNFTYDPGVSKTPGLPGWERSSEIGISTALSFRLSDRFFVGGEVRYARAYDGLFLNRATGHGVFAGPTFFARLSDNVWIAGVWNFQVAGKTFNTPGRLDLENFHRHEARLRLGISF